MSRTDSMQLEHPDNVYSEQSFSQSSLNLHVYNIMSSIGTTVPEPLLDVISESLFTEDGNVLREGFFQALKELTDPNEAISCIQTHRDTVESTRRDNDELKRAAESGIFEVRSVIENSLIYRKKDWVQKLKTPLAITENQAKLGSAKLYSYFQLLCNAEIDRDFNTRNDEEYLRFMWSLVDEFRLSYFLVIDIFVNFVEHTVQQALEKDHCRTSMGQIGQFILKMKSAVPGFEKTLQDVILTRVQLYAGATPQSSECENFHEFVPATLSSLGVKQPLNQMLVDQFSYYFLPSIPFTFTTAIGLFIIIGVMSSQWYIEAMSMVTYKYEEERYRLLCQREEFIPYWFYQAVFLHSHRSFLARRKKTCVQVDGKEAGQLKLSESTAVEDFLLYLGSWNSVTCLSGMLNGVEREVRPIPKFLIDNPFIDLFDALFRLDAKINSASCENLASILHWLEKSLELAHLRVHDMKRFAYEDISSLHDAQKNQRLELPEFHLVSSFSNFSPTNDTFSVFDYVPINRRKGPVLAVCQYLLKHIQKRSGQEDGSLFALLHRLKYRIRESPELTNLIVSNPRYCYNYVIVTHCIRPAHEMLLTVPDYTKLVNLGEMYGEYSLEFYQSNFFSFQPPLVQQRHPTLYHRSIAADTIAANDPVLQAIRQTNRELVYYKLIRLVPKTIEDTKSFINSILISSPVLIVEILIEQSIKKSDYQLMILQSKLLLFDAINDKHHTSKYNWRHYLSVCHKRLHLVSAMCYGAAKAIESGVLPIHEKINDLCSIGSFYFIACREFIHDTIRRSEKYAEKSEVLGDLRSSAFDWVREILDMIFSHMLKHRAYKLLTLMFLKAFAEHVLHKTCLSETGWASGMNEESSNDDSTDFCTFVASLGITGVSPMSLHRSIECLHDTEKVTLLDAEKDYMRKFALGKLIQWLTPFGGGHANFLTARCEDPHIRLSDSIITYLLFLERAFGQALLPTHIDIPTWQYNKEMHALLCETRESLFEMLQEECSQGDKAVILNRIRKLIDLCNDLRDIFSDEEVRIDRIVMDDSVQDRSIQSLSPYDVCYSEKAYENVSKSLEKLIQSRHTSQVNNSIEDFYKIFELYEPTSEGILCVLVHVVNDIKILHKRHRQSFLCDIDFTAANLLKNRRPSLPPVAALLSRITTSINGSIVSSQFLCSLVEFSRTGARKHICHSAPLVSVFQNIVNQTLCSAFKMLPAFTSNDCTSFGVFINLVLTFCHSLASRRAPGFRELFYAVITSAEEKLLVILNHDENCAEGKEKTAAKDGCVISSYLLQNCLTILWEIRSHLPVCRSQDKVQSCFLSEKTATPLFQISAGREDGLQQALGRLLDLSDSSKDLAIVRPQVIALVKWVKSRRERTYAKKRSRDTNGE